MASIAESVATNLVQRVIDEAIKEVSYLSCFQTHVENFDTKRKQLADKKDRVVKDIEDARKRNETQVEPEVESWLRETNGIIDEDTETNLECFYGWCPNCISQYKQRRKLAKKILDMKDLIERCEKFGQVARPAPPPGMKYYSPQNFFYFDSRKSEFKKLVDILQDGKHYMIGLQGLGGTGKTTLATKLGEQVEESKAFQKVIFAVVSNPPIISKIRQKIASHLELKLEQGKEEEHSKDLWSRIADNEGKVLIILDDIWEVLDLRDIGIPCGPNHRNCCVLITTRNLKVCEAMGCQETITLHTLGDDDALTLFIKQVDARSDSSSLEFMDLARGIVKECGGITLAIVVVATTIKGWPLQDWKNALDTLQDSNPLINIHDDLEEKLYRSLKLSYDYLKEKAQNLLLLCSLFPENYEISTSLLSKLAIGLDLFRGSDKYSEARRKVIPVKNDLIKSSFLLEANEDCIKMHDLVREVALWIAKENVQVATDSSTTLKSNLRFLFWSNEDFPNCFVALEVEILIIRIEGEFAKVRDATIFEGMTNLKVLVLESLSFSRRGRKSSITPSLQSLLQLKSIRTLILHYWKLDDISILKNLECLETFELLSCSITELPKEFSELKKLKLLELRHCDIERNNPFEVIERCSQLEELYFVQNYKVKDWKPAENANEISQDICPPLLKRYSIACSGFEYLHENGFLNCFNTTYAEELISKSMFKDLIGGAEVLEFGKIGEAKWKCIAGGVTMKDLIKLYLWDLADIQCVIDRNMVDGSFRKLQILRLQNCEKLQHLCFDGNLRLPHLKSLHLENCPMLHPSIFKSSVALCVEQLEELIIEDCKGLKSLITYESLDGDQQKTHGSPLQKLKSLRIKRCDKLELVSPLFSAGDLSLLEDLSIEVCNEIKYIFGEYQYEGQALHQDSILPSLTKIKLQQVPNFIDVVPECKISAQTSCPILKDDSKERHTTKEIEIGVSNSSLHNIEAAKDSCTSNTRLETFQTTECLTRQLLSFQNIRKMTLWRCLNLKSLFSVSIASTIMLEELEIGKCEELKDIIANDDHLNRTSIFPNLQHICVHNCEKLEFIFPSTLSRELPKLQSIDISKAVGLKYVFGAYNNDQNINVALPIHLPALNYLELDCGSEIINLCANNYYVVWPSLQRITLRQHELETEKGLNTRSSFFPDLMICTHLRQKNMETSQDYMKVMTTLTSLTVWNFSTIEEILNVEGIQSKGPLTLSLEVMKLGWLDELRHIHKGPNDILSLLNLKVLEIVQCHKLRALFTASTVKSLPRLSTLYVWFCEELVHIIEEDDHEKDAYGCSHQLCFPALESIHMSCCDGLRSLFWISATSTTLPKLKTLKIGHAPRLEEVFRCQQDDDTREMLIQNVFPNLLELDLQVLPELRTICRGIDFHFGIDFHSMPKFTVDCCPKYDLKESPIEELRFHSDTDQEIEAQELTTSASTCLTVNPKDTMEDFTEEVPVSKSAMVPSLSGSTFTTEIIHACESEDVHIVKESTVQLQRGRLGEAKTTTPFDDDDTIVVMLKEDDQVGPISEEVIVANLSADLALGNSLVAIIPEELSLSVWESFPEDGAIIKTSIATTSINSQAMGSQSGTSELFKGTDKEEGKVVPASKLSARNSLEVELINEQPRTEQNLGDQLNSRETTSEIKVPHQTNVPNMKEAVEESFQEHERSKEAITPKNSSKGFYHSLEQGKEVVEIATASTSIAASLNSKSSETEKEAIEMDLTSGLSMATASSKLEVTPSIEGTWEQGPQQNYATEESIDLDSKKQPRLVGLLEKETAQGSETGEEVAGMLQPSGLSMATTSPNLKSIGNIQEDTTTVKAKTDTPLIYSQTERSQSSSSAREARDTGVQDGHKSDMAQMTN